MLFFTVVCITLVFLLVLLFVLLLVSLVSWRWLVWCEKVVYWYVEWSTCGSSLRLINLPFAVYFESIEARAFVLAREPPPRVFNLLFSWIGDWYSGLVYSISFLRQFYEWAVFSLVDVHSTFYVNSLIPAGEATLKLYFLGRCIMPIQSTSVFITGFLNYNLTTQILLKIYYLRSSL